MNLDSTGSLVYFINCSKYFLSRQRPSVITAEAQSPHFLPSAHVLALGFRRLDYEAFFMDSCDCPARIEQIVTDFGLYPRPR